MANRPRVVHLTTVHHPLDPRIYWKEACSLSDAGFDVWLLARSAGVDDLERVEYVPLPAGTSLFARLRRQWAAWTQLKRLRPDVLHIHDPELLPLARWVKSKIGASVIYDRHEHYGTRSGIEGKVIRAIESWGLRWIDQVIIAWEPRWLDEAELDPLTYQRIAGGSDGSATPILNYALPVGVGKLATSEDVSREAAPVLVYTGTVARSRGLFCMLDLIRLARDRGLACELQIAGICNFPDQRREAESYIRAHDLGHLVKLIGWDQFASTDQIREAMAHASVGLMLARHESSYLVSIPTKFYEYMQFGLPMLVSNVPLWRDFVDETGSGQAVDPADLELVFQQLVDLLDVFSDQTRRSDIRTTARQFQWERMEGRLLSVYERLRVSS